jgi:hypothetical protein
MAFCVHVGLDIGSEPPKTISLPIMQENTKDLIKPFVEKYYPELIQSLNPEINCRKLTINL